MAKISRQPWNWKVCGTQLLWHLLCFFGLRYLELSTSHLSYKTVFWEQPEICFFEKGQCSGCIISLFCLCPPFDPEIDKSLFLDQDTPLQFLCLHSILLNYRYWTAKLFILSFVRFPWRFAWVLYYILYTWTTCTKKFEGRKIQPKTRFPRTNLHANKG